MNLLGCGVIKKQTNKIYLGLILIYEEKQITLFELKRKDIYR